jgi:hypothetical protein
MGETNTGIFEKFFWRACAGEASILFKTKSSVKSFLPPIEWRWRTIMALEVTNSHFGAVLVFVHFTLSLPFIQILKAGFLSQPSTNMGFGF